VKHITKERGSKLDKIPSLEKPSFAITAHLDMEVVCTPLTLFIYKKNATLINEGFQWPFMSMPCSHINEKNY